MSNKNILKIRVLKILFHCHMMCWPCLSVMRLFKILKVSKCCFILFLSRQFRGHLWLGSHLTEADPAHPVWQTANGAGPAPPGTGGTRGGEGGGVFAEPLGRLRWTRDWSPAAEDCSTIQDGVEERLEKVTSHLQTCMKRVSFALRLSPLLVLLSSLFIFFGFWRMGWSQTAGGRGW